jgi:hypothetical protein
MKGTISDGAWFYINRIHGIILLLLGSKRKRVYIMGDSHSLIFQRRIGVMCRHLGPITLNRFGRDGEAKALFRAAFCWPRRLNWLPFPHPTATSTVVLSFGEIDIRVHVDRVSQEKSLQPSQVVQSLVKSAINGCIELRAITDARLVFLAPPPPVDGLSDDKFPTGGSFKDRVVWMNQLKSGISSEIALLPDIRVYFCDLAEKFSSEDGGLRSEYSDGNVHYRREIGTQFLRKILNL